MDPVRQKIAWLWLGCHAAGLTSLIVLVIGGLVGQTCPAYSVNGSLKTGPFAYGDGSLTEAASLLLMAVYVLGAISTVVRTRGLGGYRVALVARSVLNSATVLIVLLGGIVVGASQAQTATLCESNLVGTIVAWLVGLTAWIIVLNWPIGRGRSSDNLAADTPSQ